MSGFLDFLFQGSPPPSVTQNATSTTTVPDWMQEYIKADLNQGNAAVSQPYQAYTGQRVAPLTTAQNQAYSNIASQQGNWQPALTQAQQQTTAASNPGLDTNAFNSYLSPYLGGVVNSIANLGQQNLTQNLLPAVNSTFTGAGQWGSSRHSDFTNQAVNNENQSVLNQQAQALQQGYDSAMSNYQTGQNRSLSGAAQTGALAQQQQQQQLQDAAALEASGQSQQNQTQQNEDVAYQDFLNQQNYQKNNASYLMSLISGAPQQTSTSTTSTGPGTSFSPSPLATIAGSLSLLNGLIGKKRGGQIQRLAHGGPVLERMALGGVPRSQMMQPRRMAMQPPAMATNGALTAMRAGPRQKISMLQQIAQHANMLRGMDAPLRGMLYA